MVGLCGLQHQAVQKGGQILRRNAHHQGRQRGSLLVHRWYRCIGREPAGREKRELTRNASENDGRSRREMALNESAVPAGAALFPFSATIGAKWQKWISHWRFS